MRVLGISAFYHDSAAALVEDGRIVAAAQEERFTRKKHDSSFPKNAIAYCLEEAGAELDDLDHAVFYDKPFLKFERLLETYLTFAPRGFSSFRMAMPLWLKEKLFQKSLLKGELKKFAPSFDVNRLLFCEHHLSHAASAFYPSPFEDAAVLTMDGVGEWATTSAAMGSGKNLEVFQEIHFPHSLGLLYSAFTYYTGFKVNSGEYKVMGLAPYGEPKYKKLILDNLIDLKPDGSFRLDLSYFDYCTGLTMTNERFSALFGEPVRSPEELLTNFHMDIAASIQAVLDEVVLRLARGLAKKTGSKNLCLAGGVSKDRCRSMTPDELVLFGIDKLNIARSEIPAVTHVDYSARIQTVHANTNPLFHRLLARFKEKTGCPVLVNTSFNVRGEPIVCTPEDAFRCFMGNELDLLVVGNCILKKDTQDQTLKLDYSSAFDPD